MITQKSLLISLNLTIQEPNTNVYFYVDLPLVIEHGSHHVYDGESLNHVFSIYEALSLYDKVISSPQKDKGQEAIEVECNVLSSKGT